MCSQNKGSSRVAVIRCALCVSDMHVCCHVLLCINSQDMMHVLGEAANRCGDKAIRSAVWAGA